MAVMLMTGCHNYDVNGTAPVRYGNSVAVIPYDHVQRAPAADITIYDAYHTPPAGYQVVANLSRPGNLGDRMKVIGALEWRARMLGANGLILTDAQDMGERNRTTVGNDRIAFSNSGPGQSMFSGIAIITNLTLP